MVYRNSDDAALMAMERERTGNYGEDGYTEPRICFRCPECGDPVAEDERYYNIEDFIICDSCLEKYECTAEFKE